MKANELADELEQRIADGVKVFPEGTKRILITGTPMAIHQLHHVIETSGAAVVCENVYGNALFRAFGRRNL